MVSLLKLTYKFMKTVRFPCVITAAAFPSACTLKKAYRSRTRVHPSARRRQVQQKDGGSAYAFSGGLHGVGVSVTNALSTRLEVTVKREGKVHRIVFSGGDVIEPLTEVGKCAVKDSGTEVRVWPDGKYFESPNYSIPELERLLRAKAVLLPGVRVSLTRPVKGEDEAYTQTWHYPDGLKSYLTDLIADAQEAVPIFSCENYIFRRPQRRFQHWRRCSICPDLAGRRLMRQRKLRQSHPYSVGRHA